MEKEIFVLQIKNEVEGQISTVGLTDNFDVVSKWCNQENEALDKEYGSETDGIYRFYTRLSYNTELGALDDWILSK